MPSLSVPTWLSRAEEGTKGEARTGFPSWVDPATYPSGFKPPQGPTNAAGFPLYSASDYPSPEDEAEKALALVTGGGGTTGFGLSSFPTEPPPAGYHWEFDTTSGIYVPVYGVADTTKPTDPTQFPTSNPPEGYEWYWDGNQYALRKSDKSTAKTGDPLKPPTETPPTGFEYDWDGEQWVLKRLDPTKAPGYISPGDQRQYELQQQQLSWQQQQAQMQQAEQERQYKSQLAANPMSWLQSEAYTKQTPVVQPWMMPLSQKDYGWQTGQQIPGWNPEGGGGMADLTNPSTQYWARMGPTAQQQYMGYQQWDKAQRPEETQFRLGAQTAPAGRNFNLQWMK